MAASVEGAAAAGESVADPLRPSPSLAPSDNWKRVTDPYKGADTARSVQQLIVTGTWFALLWATMLWSLDVSYALTLLLAVPTAGFVLRLFIIQHDCGHGSFFRSRRARDTVGFCIGVLTLIPYHYWRRTHAYHHSHSGDLDFRGFGDIDTLTVREYMGLSRLRRVAYRLYRNPVVLLGIGPTIQFLVKHRYPWDAPRSWRQAWASVWWTNACIVGVVILMSATVGLRSFLLVQGPVTLIACSVGVLLFYVQHQFEPTYWNEHDDWDFFDASLYGSSHLVLPKPLQWVTGSIGLHHVHHLSSLIPNYKLQTCMDASPELQRANRVRIADFPRLLRLSLWDERSRQLIRFADLPWATADLAEAEFGGSA